MFNVSCQKKYWPPLIWTPGILKCQIKHCIYLELVRRLHISHPVKLKTYTLWIAHHYVVKLSYTFFLQSLPSARCITTLNSLRLLALLGTIFRRNKQLFVDARSSKITAFRVMSSLILGICYQRKREKKRNNTSDSTVCFIDCSLLCWHI